MKKTLAELEAELPPTVLHAYQTRVFAFKNASEGVTVGDVDRMIRLLYGDFVANELAAHIKARVDSVISPQF